MSTTAIDNGVSEGIAEFNRARWWHAHEGWEHAWLAMPKDDPARAGLQGMIQAAAAFHLLEQRPEPAARLAQAAREKLAGASAGAAGEPAIIEASGLAGLLAAIARGEHVDHPAVRAEIARQARGLRARRRDPARDERFARACGRISRLGTGSMSVEGARALDPVRARLARVLAGAAVDPTRVVVVAGTNGKGSTCAALDALLLSAGARAGVFTSPHLVDPTERFRVAGEDISRELFAMALEAVEQACESDPPGSQFELYTLMAAWIFFSGSAGAPVDFAVLEVGLGGLNDPVNAIPHATCAIARLGIDHEAILGPGLESIARNKFGVVAPGSKVFHLPLPQEALIPRQETRARTSSQWTEVAATSAPQGLTPLPGARGSENVALAQAVFASLGFAPQPDSALERVRWPGRMQRLFLLNSALPTYLSGDHNPQGIQSLIAVLESLRIEHPHFVVGVGADKDLDQILAPLSERGPLWLTQTPYKGRALADYGEWLSQAQGAYADPIAALHKAVAAAGLTHASVIVTGSLYLVGELLRRQP